MLLPSSTNRLRLVPELKFVAMPLMDGYRVLPSRTM
jgi:hypothetical protein